MASGKEYLQFLLDQLSDLDEIFYRPMMGEYFLFYRGKLIGGIYDDRLLVKPVPAAISCLPNAKYALPYPGAKEMLWVEDVKNRDCLAGLFQAMVGELPAPKPEKRTK